MYQLMQNAKNKTNTKSDSKALRYLNEALEGKEPSFREDPEFWLNNLDATLEAIRDHMDEERIRMVIEELEGYLETI